MCALFCHYECKSEVMKRLFFKISFATDANYGLEALLFYGINFNRITSEHIFP